MDSKIKCIQLGKTYRSFAKVSDAVKEYEFENNVHLTAKYFRRIASNPKPSNKEDYMLTVEERRRFVYRWVDFCCTYFDGRHVPPLNSEEGETSGGYTVKECPMRIRFQLRNKEKDLIVNTFNEAHDHQLSGDNSGELSSSSCAMESASHLPQVNNQMSSSLPPTPPKLKANRPPPSLNAIPLKIIQPKPTATPVSVSMPMPALPVISRRGNTIVINRSAIVSQRKGGIFQRTAASRAVTVSVSHNRKSHQSQGQGSLPKPPPLQKGLFRNDLHVSQQKSLRTPPTQSQSTNNSPAMIPGASTRTIITNLHNYLLRIKTEGADPTNPNGICLVSSNPNLVKVIAEMTGMEERLIMQITQGRIPQGLPVTNPIPKTNGPRKATPAKPIIQLSHHPQRNNSQHLANIAKKRTVMIGLVNRQLQQQQQQQINRNAYQTATVRNHRLLHNTTSSTQAQRLQSIRRFSNNISRTLSHSTPSQQQRQQRIREQNYEEDQEDEDDCPSHLPLEVIIKSEPPDFDNLTTGRKDDDEEMDMNAGDELLNSDFDNNTDDYLEDYS